jgi:hypothetical protein
MLYMCPQGEVRLELVWVCAYASVCCSYVAYAIYVSSGRGASGAGVGVCVCAGCRARGPAREPQVLNLLALLVQKYKY